VIDSPLQGANTYHPFKAVDSTVTAKIQEELASIKAEDTREPRELDFVSSVYTSRMLSVGSGLVSALSKALCRAYLL